MPYFGSWPFWMPFYLESCSYNPDITWLFYTDCEPLEGAPSNVKFKSMSFDEYCQLVSDKLEIDFKPSTPYKICDVRPAMGYIHKEDLVGYDFWAFGDIDVIYGNLKEYFTASRLIKKHLFSTHARRISGHLCLIRNNDDMRNAFRDIPDWIKRFTDSEHHSLDEGAFSRLFMGHKNWPDWLRKIAEQFKSRSRKSEFMEAHSTYTLMPDGSKKTPEAWLWKKGSLYNSDFGNVKLPYCHFLTWKKHDWVDKEAEQLVCCDGISSSSYWKVSKEGFECGTCQPLLSRFFKN